MKPSIYETITSQIVAAIEAGAGNYDMPWHRSQHDVASPSNAATGNAYRGINILALWMTAEARGFGSGQWATYRQWQEQGAQVRKGETAATVILWKPLDEGAAKAADGAEPGRFVARAYSVFNSGQVDGWTAPIIPQLPEAERIACAEAFMAAVPAELTHGGNSACYIPAADRVQMPAFGQFRSAPAYYATLAHELTHWTGAKARLNRDLSGRFGSDSYAMEELVAELGAAFICGRLGIGGEPRTDHAPYIASWLKVLKGDSRAIFTAAAKAQQAADYLHSFTPPPA